ncbi:hypothetical protein A0H81_10516 [Grifola frondosa]|uniref:Uncharacterized protein n=1 Tax=Grifola frondosa TaxID=5627 RepID=A0A1C7LZU9_GRIFR|nr:hypothetical protein A0H81_10516 [Grifola frondosa]
MSSPLLTRGVEGTVVLYRYFIQSSNGGVVFPCMYDVPKDARTGIKSQKLGSGRRRDCMVTPSSAEMFRKCRSTSISSSPILLMLS